MLVRIVRKVQTGFPYLTIPRKCNDRQNAICLVTCFDRSVSELAMFRLDDYEKMVGERMLETDIAISSLKSYKCRRHAPLGIEHLSLGQYRFGREKWREAPL
jgi:hypothetical protein